MIQIVRLIIINDYKGTWGAQSTDNDVSLCPCVCQLPAHHVEQGFAVSGEESFNPVIDPYPDPNHYTTKSNHLKVGSNLTFPENCSHIRLQLCVILAANRHDSNMHKDCSMLCLCIKSMVRPKIQHPTAHTFCSQSF